MIRHHGPISGIATFGSTYIATAGYDNQLILWDARTQRGLTRVVHDHLANQVSFSPDGRHLISSSSDYTARLWSVPGMKLIAVLSAQTDDVEMSVFHPSRELIATASRDHKVRVYDFTGQVVATLAGHTADVISVEWAADPDQLVSSSDDGTIKRWSVSRATLLDDIDLGGVETDTIAITRTGTIYAGNDEGEIVAITQDGTTSQPAHAAGIKRLVYNDACELLVSLSYDRTFRIWDTSHGLVPVADATLPPEVWPRSCAFVDQDTLVFATFGTTYATYRVSTGHWDLSAVRATAGLNAVALHEGHQLAIGDAGILRVDGAPRAEMRSLCNFLTPAGGVVFTGGQLGTVYDGATGALIYQHRSPLNCGASFIKNGMPHVVIGTYTGEGLVFSVCDGAVNHVATLPLHENAVKGVAVSGGVLFAVCADTSASWFSVDSYREVGRVKQAHERIVNGCAALPGGRFASVGRDYLLRIWDGASATVISTPHDHSVKCVSASADGRFVGTGSYSGVVAVYDVAGARWCTIVRPTTAGVSSLCWDERAGQFLASSYDGNVYRISAG